MASKKCFKTWLEPEFLLVFYFHVRYYIGFLDAYLPLSVWSFLGLFALGVVLVHTLYQKGFSTYSLCQKLGVGLGLVLFFSCFFTVFDGRLTTYLQMFKVTQGTAILVADVGIVLLSFFVRQSFEIERIKKWIIFIAILLTLFLLQLIIAPNVYIIQYLKNSLVYIILPLYLLLFVKDFKALLQNHIFFSCCTGLILLVEPFQDYAATWDYMGFGFALYMFSSTGLAAGYKITRKWWYLLALLVEVGFIGIWGNKGAFIAGMVLLFLIIFDRLNVYFKGIMGVLLAIFLPFYKGILLKIIAILLRFGFATYSLQTMQVILEGEIEGAALIRTELWRQALEQGWEKFLGSGVGAFEATSSFAMYPHNIFLDILVTFGILGLFTFILVFIWSLLRTAQTKNTSLKLCRIGTLFAWFIPMQLSLTLWNAPLFWLYFGLVFLVEDRVGVFVNET